MKIALVTWSGLPPLSSDDGLLRDELLRHGADVTAAVWDDPAVDWSSFDSIVLRSTWDYHKRLGEFAAWLERMEPLPLWNPVRTVRPNLHKGYLLELERRGVPIVTTMLVPRGSSPGLLRERKWRRAVVKPAVSATAFRTFVVNGETLDPAIEELLAQSDVLVQPFVDEITSAGEWSLIFLGGTFSHAVLKTPAGGDFRVQNEFGGFATPTRPNPHLIEQAARVLETNGSPWLYARVDGVDRDGTFVLMELELTEPSLFLDADPAAPGRLATAVLAR